jgi:MYXO-CTERM domain-containing protein
MNVRSGLVSALAFAAAALGARSAHALTFDYCDFSNVSTLTLDGTASQQTKTLQLTANNMNQAGSAYRTAPVAWTATTSFHTYFTFQMAPNAAGADGISFILQNSAAGAAALGRAGGAIGYGNDSGTPPNMNGIGNSVEVEFDTYKNAWDPNANHVGIMENGNNAVHQATGTPSFTMANGGMLHAWIDYSASATTLSVYIAQTANKPAAPVVSYGAINVASLVGAQAFAGFTGATGGSTNTQQVFEWEFSTDGAPCSCDGNSECGGATPYCAPALDPEVGFCVACVTDAECDTNVNTATPVCSKAGSSTDTCVACATNADCAAATGLQPVCATSGAFLGQCVMCASNTDCAGNAAGSLCLAEVATSVCVQCESNATCAGATPVCNTTTHQCRACAADSDCLAPTPACQTSGPLTGECTQCSSSNLTACVGGAPVCDSQTGTCVGCQTNAGCAGSSPICNLTTNTCRACQGNADCASFSGDPVCATAGMRQGQCVVCQGNADCSGARPLCDLATNACVGCVTSADCSGATPICNATAGTCLPCSSDSQCAAVAWPGPSLPLCQTTGGAAGRCVQCTAQNESQCVAGSATPVCEVGTGLCGCAQDVDCASGQVCAGGQCVAALLDAGSAEGGVVDAAASDGAVADGGRAEGGSPADAGGPPDGSSSGDSGEAQDAPSAGDGSPADSEAVGSEPSSSDGSIAVDASLGEDGEALVEGGPTGSSGEANQAGDVGGGGGCACSTPGGVLPSGPGGPAGLLLVLVALAGRRRRNR